LIDLHCHILPGIDDGSPDIDTSLNMARMAVADGITTIACTPHIFPGVFDNSGPLINLAIAELTAALREADIPLRLVAGADVHIAPDIVSGLRNGRVLSINGGRYFLFEPPDSVLPPRFDQFVFGILAAGYVPVLTHPERLKWIESHYDLIGDLAAAGVLMQLTAASVTGRFGRRVKYWSDRMLDEDLVFLIASDAHNTDRRPPILTEARDVLDRRYGEEYANRLVEDNPQTILDNVVVSDHPRPRTEQPAANSGLWRRLWSRGR
jgi:protein-tyrosine phosphatase